MCLRGIAAAVFIAAFTTPALAQEFGRVGSMTASGMSYRTFVYPGEASIQILVFRTGGGGSGIYEIGTSVTMEQLLALSGVTGEGTEGRQRSRTTIRLYRENSGLRTIVYEARLGEMLQEPERHPQLREGDVMEVETRTIQRFSWRDGLSIITAASTTVLLIDRWRRITSR